MSVKSAEFDAYSKPTVMKKLQKNFYKSYYHKRVGFGTVCKSSWPSNHFQVSLFAIFFNRVKISIKFWVFWNPFWILMKPNFLGSVWHFLQTLKPNMHETAKNEWRILIMRLSIQLCIHICVQTLLFLKKVKIVVPYLSLVNAKEWNLVNC
jgi:hypothetical protein